MNCREIDENCWEIDLIQGSHPLQRKKEIKRERRTNAISNEFVLFFNNVI